MAAKSVSVMLVTPLRADVESVCTTDPADRHHCRNAVGAIDPKGADIDGDGLFEQSERSVPVSRTPRLQRRQDVRRGALRQAALAGNRLLRAPAQE